METRNNKKLGDSYFTANKCMDVVNVVLKVVETLVTQVSALGVQLFTAQDLQHDGTKDGKHTVPHARSL